MEGKRYSLRSRKSELQAKIDFPCRRGTRSTSAGKKRQTSDKRTEENESPSKRSRVTEKEVATTFFPPTSTPTTIRLTPTKSPLKETNQSPGTPAVNGFKTPANQRARKRLEFSPSVSTVPPSLTPLQKTKRSLHNSLPSTLLCRDDQLAAVREWVGERVRGEEGGALYISGAPGTGKTACVTHLLREMKSTLSDVTVLSLNCMSVTSPQALYSHLVGQLHLERQVRGRQRQSARDKILRHFTTSKKLILLVLDEMDQLNCHHQEVLYSLFEWSSLPHSKLILIGIANALDLTDRILPRLSSHAHCKPHLLNFPPYTREEIAAILGVRVGREVGGEGVGEVVMDRAAIEFCARKVSAVHGDLRKALDICRRAIELVESQAHSSSSSSSSHTPTSPDHPTPSHPHHHRSHKDMPLLHVKLPHVASIVSSVYSNGSVALSHSTSHTLPLQQKLAVATLLLCVRGRAVKEVTLGRLQDVYSRVCSQWQVRQEAQTDFVGLCHVLESRGLLSIKKAKETRLTKVTLKLQEADVDRVLKDTPLLSSVLRTQI